MLFRSVKDAKTNKSLNKEITIAVTNDKITVEPEGLNQVYYWKKMYRIIEFSHSFALIIDEQGLAFILPKRCFKDKEQIKFIREIVLKNKK